jgi:hypothetical protein
MWDLIDARVDMYMRGTQLRMCKLSTGRQLHCDVTHVLHGVNSSQVSRRSYSSTSKHWETQSGTLHTAACFRQPGSWA